MSYEDDMWPEPDPCVEEIQVRFKNNVDDALLLRSFMLVSEPCSCM